MCLALEPAAAVVVGMLEDEPADAGKLASRLADALELPSDIDIGAILENVLTPLCRAGLVARSGTELTW